MTFMIIMIVVALVLAVVLGMIGFHTVNDGLLGGGAACVSVAVIFMLLATMLGLRAKTNKALIQNHLENPTSYTYTQLAEHNEFVTERKVWQGTIFSFYNDVDLQTIDINSVSQKILIESDEE